MSAPGKLFLALGFAAAVGLALFVAPFASRSPDALERVARDTGFADREQPPGGAAPAPGYAFPGFGGGRLATAAAGAAGTLVVFGAAFVLGRIVRKADRAPEEVERRP